jgi:hypothetical protein
MELWIFEEATLEQMLGEVLSYSGDLDNPTGKRLQAIKFAGVITTELNRRVKEANARALNVAKEDNALKVIGNTY